MTWCPLRRRQVTAALAALLLYFVGCNVLSLGLLNTPAQAGDERLEDSPGKEQLIENDPDRPTLLRHPSFIQQSMLQLPMQVLRPAPDCVRLTFQPSSLFSRCPVALASFPGSGNTWLRHLVQQTTGKYTGSVYKDPVLARHGFPGENITSDAVVAVKTHEWGAQARKSFNRALLVIRSPYDALRAEFNRRYGGHRGHAPSRWYIPKAASKQNAWGSYVESMGKAWVAFHLDWLTFDGNLTIIRYEDMKKDLPSALLKIQDFFSLSITDSHLQCVLRNSDGLFKRPSKTVLDYDPFPSHVKETIEIYKHTVALAVRARYTKECNVTLPF